MPLVRVELFERRLTPELESRLIDRLTETLIDTLFFNDPATTEIYTLSLHDAHRWGRNGKPWDEG